MTVGRLIKELRKYHPDLGVIFTSTICDHSVIHPIEKAEFSKGEIVLQDDGAMHGPCKHKGCSQ